MKRIAFAAAVLMAAGLAVGQSTATAATSTPVPPAVATQARAGATVIPALVNINIPPVAAWGAPVGSTTVVTDGLKLPLAGWPVTLQRMDVGSLVWKPVAGMNTTTTGSAKYAFSNASSASYRWATAAMYFPDSGDTIAPRYSAVAKVLTTTAITMWAPPRLVKLGQDVPMQADIGSYTAVTFPRISVQYRATTSKVWINGTSNWNITSGHFFGRISQLKAGTYAVRLSLATSPFYVGSDTTEYLVTVL